MVTEIGKCYRHSNCKMYSRMGGEPSKPTERPGSQWHYIVAKFSVHSKAKFFHFKNLHLLVQRLQPLVSHECPTIIHFTFFINYCFETEKCHHIPQMQLHNFASSVRTPSLSLCLPWCALVVLTQAFSQGRLIDSSFLFMRTTFPI